MLAGVTGTPLKRERVACEKIVIFSLKLLSQVSHALSHLIRYDNTGVYTRGIDTHGCVDIARIYRKNESERFTSTWYDCGWPSLYHLPRFSTRNKRLGIVAARTTGFCKKNTRNLYFHAEVNRRPYARDWPRSIDLFVIREISILLSMHLCRNGITI